MTGKISMKNLFTIKKTAKVSDKLHLNDLLENL